MVGILIAAHLRGHRNPINILNIYAPYKNRWPFWDKLFESEILYIDFLMIAGDLNVSLSMEEIWGAKKKSNPIADRIKNELLCKNLIDILPPKMVPTWENGRIESAYIAKRLERFILHDNLIEEMGMPFSSIENVYISNHRPIILGWREKGFRKGYSFKFNRTCLEDPVFNEVIAQCWKEMSSDKSLPCFMTFRDKMDAI